MNAADRRHLTPMIGIAAVVLAALLIALWAGLGSGATWGDAAAAPKLSRVDSTAPPLAVAPLKQYSAVWQHPLFSPTRTPEPATGRKTEASGDLQLTGVIMLPGLKMAILHDKRTGKDYRAIAGQSSHGGPVLVELHPRSAVVDSGGSRLQLRLVPGPPANGGNAGSDVPDEDAQPVPQESAGTGASAMVTRHGMKDAAGRQTSGAGAASAEARVRELRARIEQARRRRANQDGGG